MIHSTTTLCYSLVDGPLSLEPLRVLDSRGFDWRNWRVTVYALGASHAVSFERETQRLTELLTCAPPVLSPSALLSAPAHLPQEFCREAHGLRCRVQIMPFALADGDALPGEYAEPMTVEYPIIAGLPTPMTRIGWRIDGTRLIVETVHTYPEEGRGARSRSVWETKQP